MVPAPLQAAEVQMCVSSPIVKGGGPQASNRAASCVSVCGEAGERVAGMKGTVDTTLPYPQMLALVWAFKLGWWW